MAVVFQVFNGDCSIDVHYAFQKFPQKNLKLLNHMNERAISHFYFLNLCVHRISIEITHVHTCCEASLAKNKHPLYQFD